LSSFNLNNSNYLTGEYPIFLGQALGLYDTVNITYPRIESNYIKQRSQMWSESEVSLDQSRKDFATCSKNNYDVMIKNLAYQWSADSLAKSIITLLSPFLTNNEAVAAFMFQSNMEVIHSRTYSEIVRQCIKSPEEVFEEILKNKHILSRLEKVQEVFESIEHYGLLYTSGEIEVNDELRLTLLKGMFALLALEGIQFISSFAATFAMGEQQLFIGACKLIQKICLDEIEHSNLDMIVIEELLKEPEWKKVFEDNKQELTGILNEVVKAEEVWSNYLFSEGRVVLGLNSQLLKEWLWYNAYPIYKRLGLHCEFKVTKNPLSWMEQWMNTDMVQSANQEIQSTAYKLNSIKDSEDEEYDF
jgi:ribonucleoside-diphosphate reductase beta chain